MKKKWISLITALMMAVTIFAVPTSVSFADETTGDSATNQETVADDSGTVTEDLPTDTPTADDPSTDNPTTDDPTQDEPTSQEPTTQELAIKSFKVSARGKSALKLKWTQVEKATGYILYKKGKSGYKKVKTLSGNGKTTYTVKKLSAGKAYAFKVKSYTTLNGNTYYGKEKKLTTVTKPKKVKLKKVSTSPLLRAYVKWKKTKCTGYQIQVSTSSKYRKAKIYTVKSSKKAKKTIKKLKNKKKYYIRVRAYAKRGSEVAYGAWSKTKKIKTRNKGWMKIKGKRCYVRHAKVLRGNKKVNGNPYYFDKKTGEVRGASYTMWKKVKNKKSGTKYLVAVSKKKHRVCIYKRSKGKWVLKKYYVCTVGAASTPTPSGTYTIPKAGTYVYTFGYEKGYSVYYATRIWRGYMFHSILYKPGSKSRYVDKRLGKNLSHGCIRLATKNAKWMYRNIKAGTKVVIF